MDIRKDSLSALKICRFCLTQDETLRSLYGRDEAPKKSVTLPLKILSCMSMEVFPSDKMPSFICSRCKFFMDMSYEYKQICRQADERILQFIQNAKSLESIPWPPYMNKIFSESASVDMTKISGASMQVSHDSDSDDDDDDDNIYDIKIDGSDEGSKNVKVIASPKKQMKKTKKGKDSEDTDMEGRVLSGLQDGCWPCDECDCTYPLQQLLELHKKQKHRARTVPCDKCDAKFFSNYDLITHQLRHSDEMLFQCVACDKKFKRLIRLKRHEKIVHADIPQKPCPSCPATFLSLEELEAHQKKHVRHTERRYVCPICDRRFFERSTLQRHKENIHDKSPEFSCEYCPERFTTVSKLTRHVREHASARAYPCKYCDKSFVKSHHYTRHLRIKHREMVSTVRGPFGESFLDQYRCEQCKDSFSTQDELIYHSAIHATQNLTCPLCQEKFDDVDAVTAHIKSHVNGTEFMCELCELVFTSNEKLEMHMANAHEDEMRNSEDLGQDESSMEMDAEEDEDDNTINVKEEDGHMVVEIKKPDEFLINNSPHGDVEDKIDNTNSEESETEATYTELATVDTLAMVRKESPKTTPSPAVTEVKPAQTIATQAEGNENQTASILRKAEEIKRKVVKRPTPDPVADKKGKPNNKSEGGNTVGASDKSLRLLEKELQELKRTNTRNEAVKTASKPVEMLRNRRPQIHTSTPKLRTAVEDKKVQQSKAPATEKKVIPERRTITKENKEPKDTKTNNTNKEDNQTKEKETPKTVVKNGTNDKSGSDEGVRRSTRPSKIKDYAKMIRDRSQVSDEDEDTDDSEEYKEEDKSVESRPRQRRSSVKPTPPKPAPKVSARKRGRPRKDASVIPSKVKKEDNEDDDARTDKTESDSETKSTDAPADTTDKDSDSKKPAADAKSEVKSADARPSSGILMSPTGQTLKKIPIKSLPPGVKALPLPISARPVTSGEVCEMQIGKKVVKVQKIVMTKAEVEAMAKKGLVEMKDGTMVLKQGIKLPTSDPSALKSSLVGQDPVKESPLKKEKATPSRCELGDS